MQKHKKIKNKGYIYTKNAENAKNPKNAKRSN